MMTLSIGQRISAMPPADRLIIFTRFPAPGRSKTRLIPALGEAGAADLHRQMTEHLMGKAVHLSAVRSVALEVRFDGGTSDTVARWLGGRCTCRPQGGGDIGQRMRRALQCAHRQGAKRAVLVGCDIPGIGIELLSEAFDRLILHDVVLGPAADGGYYLLGTRRDSFDALAPALFQGIPWGTESVYADTLSAIGSAASVFSLATLRDVDRPEDLSVWEAHRS
jgi:rSAM/selenodomain-associated transferase 1